ncbi:MAG: hypothetical protein ACK5KM_11785 [Hyphomicrobiaceae bacterium]
MMTYPLTADGGPDDLPRTVRREKEAREREAREREAAEQARDARETLSIGDADSKLSQSDGPSIVRDTDPRTYTMPDANYMPVSEPIMPASVERFNVPFSHMAIFFLKAVVAAIPALILLTAIMWVAGAFLKFFFPWLVKAQILIHFPN